tara:strand:+ start:352 stop:2178 length:1827 start_codon:yes stop_codon:yes gene_type:complete
MTGYAARQSTYVDGDVIDAADSNDEFDAILAAFGSTSGHNHDGTGGEGARITVVGTADDNVTFGSALTPDANNTIDIGTSGAQFKDIYIDGTAYLDAIDFNGTAISSTAAELNIVDGGTSATSTTLADADRVVVNDNGTMVQVALTDFETYFESALDTLSNVTTVGALNAGSITSGFGAIDNGSSNITTTGLISGGSLDIDDVLINGTNIGHTDDTDLITLANGVVTVAGEVSMTTLDIGGTNVTSTAAELNILDGVTSTASELNILDGVTATASELNIMDGDTSASSTTVADADRVVFNDNGTMKQVAVTDLAAYFDDEITAMPNLVSTGALDSGSITSGFGTIDTGSSNITTTGLISGGSLDIDDVLINGTTIGHTDDTDLITLANGVVTVAGEVSMTTLDIGGTNVTSTAAELNILDGVTATASELNILDGVTATASELNILDGVTATASELNILDGVTATASELNILDGVTATATELNIMDGNTSASSTTVADADRVVYNDDGTMKQVAVTDLDTYISATTKTLTNKTLTTPTITTPVVNAGLQLKNGATSAGFIEFFEDSDNGTNKATLIGPASTADVTLTLPSTTGTIATDADITALAIALG